MSIIEDIFSELDELNKYEGACLVFMSTNEAVDTPPEGWRYALLTESEEFKAIFPGEYTDEEITEITRKYGMRKPMLIQIKIFGKRGPLSGMLDEESIEE